MLKDSKGDAIMATDLREKANPNAESIESLAIFIGIQLRIHLEILHLIIKLDCQIVVNELLHPEESYSLR